MNLWTALLFLDGALTDVALTRELAGEPASAGAADADAASALASPPTAADPAADRAWRSYWIALR